MEKTFEKLEDALNRLYKDEYKYSDNKILDYNYVTTVFEILKELLNGRNQSRGN